MGEPASSSVAETRRHQMFPVLTAAEMQRLGRFGEHKRYRSGDLLVQSGRRSPCMLVLISGRVTVLRHDGLGHISPIVELGPGGFVAEIAELSGQPALVDVRAEGDVEALVVPTDNLRALMIAEAELGERILRALILRRVYLIETKAAGPVLLIFIVAAIYYLALTTIWTFIQAYIESRLARQLGIEQRIPITQRLLGARRAAPALQPQG